MYEWRYKAGEISPSFILAADARLLTTNYINDHIWELVCGRSEPPAVTIQTTYGLRAKALRIFHRFGVQNRIVSDPADFVEPPIVRHYGPAWIQTRYQPVAGLRVQSEYYVLHTQAVCGRIKLKNTNTKALPVTFELGGVLTPGEQGERMHAAEMGLTHILRGATGGLYPVLFITGGARPSSGVYACLEQALILEPEETLSLRWTCAACDNPADSFELARSLSSQNPDEFLARVEMIDSGLLQIRTGNPAWNQAFDRVQVAACSLLQSPTEHLPHISFVHTRLPDNGYSLRGDGSDFGPLWNGQAALPALYLAQFFLPANPAIARGFLENFLAARSAKGADWKPGLSGQRSHFLATPLLASLAWEIYQYTGDADFVRRVFPSLLEIYQAWFTPEQDRDGDGIPEWSNPLQTGLEDHPAFVQWLEGAPGLDITTIESPDLLTFLYREGEILRRMAVMADQKASLKFIQPHLRALQKAVIHSWDPTLQIFNPRDRDSHHTSRAEILGSRTGAGSVPIRKKFKPPVRLRICIIPPEGQIRPAEGSILGNGAGFNLREQTGAEMTAEVLPGHRFRWRPGHGQSTSQAVFEWVEEVVVENISAGDEVRVETVELIMEDISGLAPLWAGLAGEKQAQEMCSQAILNPDRYGRPFGIPNAVHNVAGAQVSAYHNVSLPWNMLIIQGLLAHGMRREAATLFSRIMDACSNALASDGAFRRFYNANTGQGSGERGALEGLPPMGLFLDVLGVRVFSPLRVHITGENPFPWPVTVRYRGLTVLRQKEKTVVIFPDGQTATVSGPGSYEVSL